MNWANKKEKNSILFISPYFYPAVEFGGPVTALFELANSMAKKGFRITVLTTDLGVFGGRLKGREKYYGAIKVVYSKSLLPKLAWKYGLFLSLDQLFKSYFYIKRASIIHFHDFYVLNNFFISFICRLLLKPYVLSPHGSFTFEKTRGKSLFKKLFYYLFMKYCVDNAEFVHAVSENEARQIKKSFPKLKNKVKYVPNIVHDLKRIKTDKIDIRNKYGIKPKSKIILFLGRINAKKGVLELLRGFRKFKNRYKTEQVQLVFAGPDAGRLNQLRELTRKFGLSEWVTFTGTVEGSIKKALLEQSSLLCLLSFSEGMATVILEATSVGTPVVFTKECNTVSLAREMGGIITNRSSREVSSSISKILGNREFYAKNAKKWFYKNFSYKVVSKQYEEIYNKLG